MILQKSAGVFLALTMLMSSAMAESLQVEYSRFYSHVKKLDEEDTQALQFAFGFIHVNENRLCRITDAKILTDKQDIPLTVTDEGRFTVPDEKALKMADAVVSITLDDQANQCDMSVQLETRPEYLKTNYSHEDLLFLIDQYTAFFNEMGSFLSFMMPSVEGLMFQFADQDLDRVIKNAPHINKGILVLDQSWIEQGRSLSLPEKPLRVTAKASRT